MKCGDFGGKNARGSPCERSAGWGVDAPAGPCTHHVNRSPREHAATNNGAPAPPTGLSDQAAGVWSAVLAEWLLGSEELLVLEGALECWDTYTVARALVRREGPVSVSLSGVQKRHPALLVARDSFRDFRESFRQLGLDTSVAPAPRGAE